MSSWPPCRPRATPPSATNRRTGTAFRPSWASPTPSTTTTRYGQYAEGFRTPTAKALYGRFENPAGGYVVQPNPNLEPEKSKSYGPVCAATSMRATSMSPSSITSTAISSMKTPCSTATTRSTSGAEHQARHHQGRRGQRSSEPDRFGAPQGLYTQGSVAYAYGRNDDTGQPLNSVNPLTGVFGLGYEQDSYGGLLSWTLVKRKNRVDDTTFFSPTAALRAGVLPAMACST